MRIMTKLPELASLGITFSTQKLCVFNESFEKYPFPQRKFPFVSGKGDFAALPGTELVGL